VKKIICPLGLEIEKIHACKEDFMLCIGDYAELTEYPFSKTLRYKRKKDEGDEEVPRKGNEGP
jgi:hypothetical protein